MKTKTQHTPGPWAVSPYNNVTSRNGTIAKTEQMPGNDDSERESNANLIASAPDMFDALQAIVDAFGDQDSLLIDQCKAALSKAKGEA